MRKIISLIITMMIFTLMSCEIDSLDERNNSMEITHEAVTIDEEDMGITPVGLRSNITRPIISDKPIVIFKDYTLICKNQDLEKPCAVLEEGGSFKDKKWSDGSSMENIGSARIYTNAKAVLMSFVKEKKFIFGTIPFYFTKRIMFKDNIVNLDKNLKAISSLYIKAPVKLCSEKNLKGTSEYVWETDNNYGTKKGFFGKYSQVKSLKIEKDWEALVCTAPNFGGICKTFHGPTTRNDTSIYKVTYVSSIQVRPRKNNAPLKVCKGKSLSGYCEYFHIQDVNLADKNGITGFNDQIKSMKIGSGYKAMVCTDENFSGTCKYFSGPRVVDLESAGMLSTSSLDVRNTAIFSTHDYESNYPHDSKNKWSDISQGVTHDNSNWYFSQKKKILKIPARQSLNGNYTAKTSRPDGCNHFGDITYYNDFVYAPLETCPEDSGGKNHRLYLYDTNLKPKKYAIVDQDHFAWIAVDPKTGYLYSSAHYKKYDDTINVYKNNFINGEELELLYQIKLNRSVKCIQGGVISQNGNLYLTSDNTGSTSKAGIYVFQIIGKKGYLKKKIGPNGYSPGWSKYEEIEGITLWDVEGKDFTVKEGQIHWTLLNQEVGDDRIYFKHISVDDPSKL